MGLLILLIFSEKKEENHFIMMGFDDGLITDCGKNIVQEIRFNTMEKLRLEGNVSCFLKSEREVTFPILFIPNNGKRPFTL